MFTAIKPEALNSNVPAIMNKAGSSEYSRRFSSSMFPASCIEYVYGDKAGGFEFQCPRSHPGWQELSVSTPERVEYRLI